MFAKANEHDADLFANSAKRNDTVAQSDKNACAIAIVLVKKILEFVAFVRSQKKTTQTIGIKQFRSAKPRMKTQLAVATSALFAMSCDAFAPSMSKTNVNMKLASSSTSDEEVATATATPTEAINSVVQEEPIAEPNEEERIYYKILSEGDGPMKSRTMSSAASSSCTSIV